MFTIFKRVQRGTSYILNETCCMHRLLLGSSTLGVRYITVSLSHRKRQALFY